MKIYSLVLVILFSGGVLTQTTYNMSNTTVNTCDGIVYDDGGPGGDYTETDYVMTICASSGTDLYFVLNSMSLGSAFNGDEDIFIIYDGTGTGGAVLFDSQVSSAPSAITASSGCITLELQTDPHFFSTDPGPGFELVVSCTVPETCSDGILNNGEAQIDCGGPNCAPCWQPTACNGSVVVNGDFETIDAFGCANNTDSEIHSDATSCDGWYGTTQEAGPQGGITPDYWTIAGCGVSPNITGSVGPCASGQGALGFFPAREEVQSALVEPLQAGKEYCLTVDVASSSANSATSDLFFWFHNNVYTSGTGIYDLVDDNGGATNIVTGIIGATPQIVNDPGHVFTDQCEQFIGSFCAAGGEDHIVVGGSYATGITYLIIDNLVVTEACPLSFDSQITASGTPDCAGSCVDLYVETSNQAGGCEITNDFTFQWYENGVLMPGQTNDTLLSVCPTATTTYSCEITYSAGCSSYTKLENETAITFNCGGCSLNVTTAVTDETCDGADDGSVDVTINGGSTYDVFVDGLPVASGVTTPTTETLPGLPDGTYTVLIVDTSDPTCDTTFNITINPGANPTAPVAGTDATYCSGDPISDLTATAGFGGTLTWYDDIGLTNSVGTGATFTPPATPGTVTYYVTETVGTCESPSTAITITIQSCCDLDVTTAVTDETCDGADDGSVGFTINGSGTYDVLIDGNTEFNDVTAGGQNWTGQADGTYAVQIVDINDPSCDTTFNITINPGTLITIDSEASTDVTDCVNPDGTFTVTSTGGTSYELYTSAGGLVSTNATGNFTGLNAGDYYVIATDGTCSAQSSTLTIANPSAPAAPMAGTDASYCVGDPMADLTATAGSAGTLNWYDDAGLTNNIGTGITLTPGATVGTTIYYVTETVAGCESAASSVTITINAIPAAPTAGTDATYCLGDALADMTANGTGGTMNWYDDAGLTNNIGTGTTQAPANTVGTTIYYVTETVGVCTSTASQVTITINDVPTINSETATDLTDCVTPNGTITITSTGTDYELFTSAGVSVGTNTTGMFTGLGAGDYYVVVSNGNCTSQGATLTITDQTTTSTNTVNAQVCTGSTYTFADGTQQVINSATSYVSTLTNSVGCDSIVTENVTPVQSTTTVIDTTICEGDNYTSVGDAANFVNVLADFQHTSTLTASNGCDSIIVENVTVIPSPTVDLGNDFNGCFGETITLTATTNSGTPVWSTGDTTSSITFVADTDTFFVATVTGTCGTDTDTIFITVLQAPDIDAGPDVTIPLGGTTTLTATSTTIPISYVWDPSTGLSCTACDETTAGPLATTQYIVAGTDENGCIGYDTVLVTIDGEISIYIPNIFSPNNDGENDYFRVYGPAWSTYKLQIYNRWGGLVYESEDQNGGWDGKHFKSGAECPQAVFVYKFTGVSIVGQTVEKAGNVMLTR